MKRSNCIRGKNVGLVTSNLHRHCRRTREQRSEKDLVLNNNIGTGRWLPRRVSCCAVAGARGGGGETVPEVEFFFLDALLAGLVRVNVVGEEVAPVIVGHVIHVTLCAIGDALFFDGADVVGFAVVIPGKNL